MAYPDGTITTGLGFAPYILADMAAVARQNDPQSKMDHHGFSGLLATQARPEVVKLVKGAGNFQTASIKYKQRLTATNVSSGAGSCDVTSVNPYREADVKITSTRSAAVYIEDQLLSQYQTEMQTQTALPGAKPGTSVSRELFSLFMTLVNAINGVVEDDLLTAAVPLIGVNRVTGNNNTKTINLNKDANTNDLSTGETDLMVDWQLNLNKGRPQMVGSGNMHAYALNQHIKNAANQSGIDTRLAAAMFDFYLAPTASTILGANQCIAYSPDSIQMVEALQNTGQFAGVKPGASSFGTIQLPIVTIGMNGTPIASTMGYDWQLKYEDCEKEFTDGYSGNTVLLQRGWNLIVTKRTGLFAIPTDAYSPADPMAGNRGSYRYTFTNDCDSCA